MTAPAAVAAVGLLPVATPAPAYVPPEPSYFPTFPTQPFYTGPASYPAPTFYAGPAPYSAPAQSGAPYTFYSGEPSPEPKSEDLLIPAGGLQWEEESEEDDYPLEGLATAKPKTFGYFPNAAIPLLRPLPVMHTRAAVSVDVPESGWVAAIAIAGALAAYKVWKSTP